MRRFEVKLGCGGWFIVDDSDCRVCLRKDGQTSYRPDYWPSENAARHFLTERTRIGNKPHVMEALNTLCAYMKESGYGRATISANGGASFELEA